MNISCLFWNGGLKFLFRAPIPHSAQTAKTRSSLVDRMARIDRPAINTNVRKISAHLHQSLCTVMARLAKRLQLAEPKLVDVAVMRFNMISNGSWSYDASLEAERTKRLNSPLMFRKPLPPRQMIQALPFNAVFRMFQAICLPTFLPTQQHDGTIYRPIRRGR